MRVTVSFFRKYAGGALLDTLSTGYVFRKFEVILSPELKTKSLYGCLDFYIDHLFRVIYTKNHLFLNADGVRPVEVLKLVAKYWGLLKPQA